jgi:N-acetylglucosamine kinase-like BadF-type ATPase
LAKYTIDIQTLFVFDFTKNNHKGTKKNIRKQMILIAESGSTKTDWRLLNDTKNGFETIGLNPYFVSSGQIAEEIAPHFSPFKATKIDKIHFYGTGITDDSKSAIIKEGILKALGYSTNIYTYSDVVAAARALFGNTTGIACILGTGSNSCHWNGQKIEFQIPPLGFWLGDEGSGGHLGKLLMLDYLHKEMPENIRGIFEKKYGSIERTEVMTKAYKEDKPNKYFASYSHFLYENYDEAYCQAIISSSFEAFLKKYLLKYPNITQMPLGFIGSVAFYYAEILEKVCSEHGLKVSKIIEKPIGELVKFHANIF